MILFWWIEVDNICFNVFVVCLCNKVIFDIRNINKNIKKFISIGNILLK